jgi:hypothetical protein
VEWRYGKPPTSTPTEGFGASSGRDVTSRQTIDTTTQRYPDFPVLRITKADLKTAPEFHYQRPAVR